MSQRHTVTLCDNTPTFGSNVKRFSRESANRQTHTHTQTGPILYPQSLMQEGKISISLTCACIVRERLPLFVDTLYPDVRPPVREAMPVNTRNVQVYFTTRGLHYQSCSILYHVRRLTTIRWKIYIGLCASTHQAKLAEFTWIPRVFDQNSRISRGYLAEFTRFARWVAVHSVCFHICTSHAVSENVLFYILQPKLCGNWHILSYSTYYHILCSCWSEGCRSLL